MTKIFEAIMSNPSKPSHSLPSDALTGHWVLHDAKARFSELIRCARQYGPQYVTVHGRDAVVVISSEEFRRFQNDMTGQALIDALQASPYRDIELVVESMALPVREVSL